MYTLSHGSKANASQNLSVGGITIPAGGSVEVSYLDTAMLDAIDSGYLSATPSLPGLMDVTDNTGGTIPSGYAVASFSSPPTQTEMNDFAALVLDRVQALTDEVSNLRTQVAARNTEAE